MTLMHTQIRYLWGYPEFSDNKSSGLSINVVIKCHFRVFNRVLYKGIYLFWVLHRFQHCTGHITMGSWKGRRNQYMQLVKVLYCKLPTNGKQLPAFPLEVGPGTEPRPQRWEARVLPLCHRGPLYKRIMTATSNSPSSLKQRPKSISMSCSVYAPLCIPRQASFPVILVSVKDSPSTTNTCKTNIIKG